MKLKINSNKLGLFDKQDDIYNSKMHNNKMN